MGQIRTIQNQPRAITINQTLDVAKKNSTVSGIQQFRHSRDSHNPHFNWHNFEIPSPQL